MSTYDLPHFFPDYCLQKLVLKNKSYQRSLQGLAAHNSALPKEHKITINSVQLAFSVNYAETKLLFKYCIAIAA